MVGMLIKEWGTQKGILSEKENPRLADGKLVLLFF